MKHSDRNEDPVLGALSGRRPLTWWRSDLPASQAVIEASRIDDRLVDNADQRFTRFAPWFAEHYPEAASNGGIIESPVVRIDRARDEVNALGVTLSGSLWVKRDDSLPVSGSIKARGGFHEVLEFAEQVAAEAGLDADDWHTYDSPEFLELARAHRVVVGSTGNLGLSIGILSAALGFAVDVHMSVDARAWKKDLLRERGATVIEHEGPFDEAVAAGRESAEGDARTHFVDDEDSRSLFAGYAVAARRLRQQLADAGIVVDAEHRLVVSLPCGVGGGPGGVTYGLKQEFGDAVHCVFAEPVDVPSVTLGVRTGKHSDICVQDIGLSGRTAADGLAVARPSRFVGERIGQLIDGFATVDDNVMRAAVGLLSRTEGIAVEPSATAGLTVPWRIARGVQAGELRDALDAPTTTHLVWLTGGSMVPEEEIAQYIEDGDALSSSFATEAELQ
ncbi:D-serine ammonia-lyase [Leucobacter tardus]|uniref:Probable D-serine dehydratase n=1 Tax=Leucobacter tardus TaxID=501483 RepID=A0A939QG57_9MICO|nr:D-serine ammonia-lyase [Leucobacter tardus]MBO2990250.1 D-serine ammonia-lyase [Leucobacter tardus]